MKHFLTLALAAVLLAGCAKHEKQKENQAINNIMTRARMVQDLLGLPEHIIPLCVVPVGVPAEHPEVKDKYKPENIHYNEW